MLPTEIIIIIFLAATCQDSANLATTCSYLNKIWRNIKDEKFLTHLATQYNINSSHIFPLLTSSQKTKSFLCQSSTFVHIFNILSKLSFDIPCQISFDQPDDDDDTAVYMNIPFKHKSIPDTINHLMIQNHYNVVNQDFLISFNSFCPKTDTNSIPENVALLTLSLLLYKGWIHHQQFYPESVPNTRFNQSTFDLLKNPWWDCAANLYIPHTPQNIIFIQESLLKYDIYALYHTFLHHEFCTTKINDRMSDLWLTASHFNRLPIFQHLQYLILLHDDQYMQRDYLDYCYTDSDMELHDSPPIPHMNIDKIILLADQFDFDLF